MHHPQGTPAPPLRNPQITFDSLVPTVMTLITFILLFGGEP
ncbi:hypothetical protein HNQ50_002900 [Silvimonas terrae]|uniref:Uncharacterized protein n=1 Tax=Silvimonas terrae TaxID=300266 RepID=A0A840RIW4_9NEIS|nr:hypothetical protein [Silvimonas terrae]